jgi:hypothetical protein
MELIELIKLIKLIKVIELIKLIELIDLVELIELMERSDFISNPCLVIFKPLDYSNTSAAVAPVKPYLLLPLCQPYPQPMNVPMPLDPMMTLA